MPHQQGGGALRLVLKDDTPPPVTQKEVSRLLAELGPALLEISRASEGPTPNDCLPPMRRASARILAFLIEHTAY